MLYLRVNVMNHDFVHIFRFLRPVGGFVELLKILHVDVQAAAAMDVTSGDPFVASEIVYNAILSRSFNSLLPGYTHEEASFLEDDVFDLVPAVKQELTAARNEADHVLATGRMCTALETGAYTGEVGQLVNFTDFHFKRLEVR